MYNQFMNMMEITAQMRENKKIEFKDQLKIVILLSVPAILEQLVGTAMSYIDTAMVGSLGYKATAAIGVVASTTWLFGGICTAAVLGFSVQVAQYLGAGKNKLARQVVCQSILFNIIFGLCMALIVVGASFYLPTLLGADPSICKDATLYLAIVGAFIPFNMMAMLHSGMLRCSGNAVLPSLMNISMCVFDVLFNYFFIYILNLKVAGAALGTGMAQLVVGFILMYIVVKKESSLRLLGDESWKFDKDILKNVVNLSIPAGLERVTLSLAQVVMTGVVSSMGAVSVAINYVAVSAEGLCYLPAYGIGGAATTLVGQSIGAKRKDMAKRFAYLTTLLSFVLVIVMSVILFAFAPFLASTLTNSQEVIDGASECLRIVSFSEPLFAISIVVMGALRGAGDSKRPFVLNALSMWGMRVLPIIIFTKRYGVIGVWITMTFELVFRGMIFFIRMVRGKWLDQNSIE